ncbi:MAG: hypothetical protein AB1531_04090 [Chloroflexota bacterium]
MSEIIISPPDDQAKHSKIGIASFVLALLGLFLFCTAMLLALVYGASLGLSNPSISQDPYQTYRYIDQTSPVFILSVVLSCCGPILNLVGLGLGIAAVAQKIDKKIFGILGLVISGLVLLTYCGLTVLGLVMQIRSY